MPSLERRSPLGAGDFAHDSFGQHLTLREEQFLGVAKIVANEFTKRDDERIMHAIEALCTPTQNRVVHGIVSVACVSPKERLLLGDKGAVARALNSTSQAITGTSRSFSLDHKYVSMQLSGAAARGVLSSLTPIDYHSTKIVVDYCLRTVFCAYGVFVQRLPGANSFRLIVDQSHASFIWRMIEDAAIHVS